MDHPVKFGWLSPAIGNQWSDHRPIVVDQCRTILPIATQHFDSVWIADHFYGFDAKTDPFMEAWTTLTWIAATFDDVDVCHHVLGQGYRPPALTAKMAATLQVFSGGRLMLGIGAGWRGDEYEAYGYDFPSAAVRFAQLEETIQICRVMWTEDLPSYTGEHYRITEAAAPPLPDVVPPICIGAMGEQIGLPLVGRQADVWHCFVGAPEDWARKKAIVADAATGAGRDPSTIAIATTNERALPESDSESAELLDLLSRQHEQGVSQFVMDFGNPADTEPILRFAEQVIAPIRARIVIAEPDEMRVVFVVVDALPNQWVGPDWTPNLWALASEGGWNPQGGRAVLSTATYPNHATFATGRTPASHGIFVNRVWDGASFVSSSSVGPRGDTLFLAARRAGVSTAVIVGDHKLIGVMGAGEADRHWPPGGRRPDVVLDEFRYAADRSVIDAVDDVDLVSASLAVVHFNEPDTACHMYGPDAPETAERVRRSDQALGELFERLRPAWSDTIVMVVSDHDQEVVTGHGFDLQAALAERNLPGIVETEGTAALVLDGPPVAELLALDGIEGAEPLDERNTLVWGGPGQVFGPWLDELRGSHGSPRCATQVAVVGGGHAAVGRIAEAVRRDRPDATWWAPTISGLLGLELLAPVPLAPDPAAP